jgi:hypothetical protein
MMKMDLGGAAMTVKGLDRSVLNRFASACRLEGKTMVEVVEVLLRDYSVKTFKRLGKSLEE